MRTLRKAACISTICLPGCIIVKNRYSLFDFDKLRQSSEAVSGTIAVWQIVCAVVLSLIVVIALAFAIHKLLRWKTKRNSN